MSERTTSSALRGVLAQLAPGTDLREGLERILRGRTGALIVLGFDRTVEDLSDGGFQINIDFSPTRLRELSKMDGAVILNDGATKILRANVQLMPDPTIPTVESGTRHRTAERTAIQTGLPIISVSHSMSIISLYFGGSRYVVADSSSILARANQALATLQRYRDRLDEVSHSLSALEIEDFTTLRDVMTVMQRLLMVRRIADEIASDIVELGSDGRLPALQLEELTGATEGARELLVRDYLPDSNTRAVEEIVSSLDSLEEDTLLDMTSMAREFGYVILPDTLDHHVSPRGYRLLAGIPRVPPAIQERLISHFENLQGLLAATAGDLQMVDGVGEARARVVREGLSRLAESSIVDRFGATL
ncbi:DNA integrity scanning protein DisA [Nakamurella antarctica]|uniref:DNA integrity scanning protein DisA n=1 Tax=Nakamurella antarctica TaxID=1902245 RepID=A0A3G8ZXN9_9ACTN|nr:DNA integrity scanning diadenylate cyclase DisA [Nakamurella antarctica]AZI58776.1 DNA integrity scanning protein DisA [Nakamurella antarctica]